MGAIASLITSLTIVYSTVNSDADQRKHQSSASLAFVWGIHRGPVNSPHKWPVTRKMFPFDDVILGSFDSPAWYIMCGMLSHGVPGAWTWYQAPGISIYRCITDKQTKKTHTKYVSIEIFSKQFIEIEKKPPGYGDLKYIAPKGFSGVRTKAPHRQHWAWKD